MTERPIIFSAEMVRAILEGRKTQTRRVVKLTQYGSVQRSDFFPNDLRVRQFCPYGKPGNLLWVREGFAVQPELWADNRGPQPIHYTADQVIGFAGKPDTRQIEDYRSKPSIHMPRWASRITLEVKSVRVERLQDIREDDARAEGCDPVIHEDGAIDCGTRKTTFARLWNHIHGPDAWEANPWVWVIAFERVKP